MRSYVALLVVAAVVLAVVGFVLALVISSGFWVLAAAGFLIGLAVVLVALGRAIRPALRAPEPGASPYRFFDPLVFPRQYGFGPGAKPASRRRDQSDDGEDA